MGRKLETKYGNYVAEKMAVMPKYCECDSKNYSSVYKVVNRYGTRVLVVGKYRNSKEWIPFYRSGKIHSSYRETIKESVEMAIEDALLYA